jgi:malonate-semialdehyde dehydrogenase (acetylating)/methylmalonate-semialdehyde dehydrogenase
MTIPILKNLIGGEWQESRASEFLEVKNPAFDETIALVPKSTAAEVDQVVAASKEAFEKWRFTPAPVRAKALFRFWEKLDKAQDEIVEIMVREHGKTRSDAKGEMTRAFEYVEYTCGIPELMKGTYSEDVGRRVESYTIREPLGPFIIIPPFNFPAMIALYFCWPLACGNPVIVKPSELCPLTMTRMAEIARECRFPPGTLNVIQGGPEVGHQLITHSDVVGVTFVGSSKVAERVYKTATGNGKRAQCQGGAKNHLVINADSLVEKNMDNVVNSCYGNASQRCFAGSNLLIHEKVYDRFIDGFLEKAGQFQLGYGLDPEATLGPVVSRKSLENLLGFIDRAEKAGAKILLDGRNPSVPKYPQGYFLAPTLIEAEPEMEIFREEVFGPVRCLKKIKDLAEAVGIINQSPFGHTAVLYTENGGQARDFIRYVNTGQVGINVGTPAPIAYYPVGGRKLSFFGDLRGRANDAVDFYTDKKVVVCRWMTPFA